MMGVWHYSPPKAGLAVTPGPLLVMPTAIVTGRLAARMGHRPFLVGGALLYAVAGLWFLLVPGAEPDYLGAWLPGLVLSGLSVGMVLPSLAGAPSAGCRRSIMRWAAPSIRPRARSAPCWAWRSRCCCWARGAEPRGFRSAVHGARGAGLADGVAVPGGGHEADRDARRKAGALRRASARRALVRHERRHGFAGDQLPEGGQEALRHQQRPALAPEHRAARPDAGGIEFARLGRQRRWRWRERARARPAGGRRKASG